MPLQSVYYEASDPGLKPPTGLKEIYIPLWIHSSGGVATTSTSGYYILKGSQSVGGIAGSDRVLHTVSRDWKPDQKFVFEATIRSDNTTYRMYATIWDRTANVQIGQSNVSTTSASYVTERSAPFTLTPGNNLGIVVWLTAAGNGTLCKAYLIPLID